MSRACFPGKPARYYGCSVQTQRKRRKNEHPPCKKAFGSHAGNRHRRCRLHSKRRPRGPGLPRSGKHHAVQRPCDERGVRYLHSRTYPPCGTCLGCAGLRWRRSSSGPQKIPRSLPGSPQDTPLSIQAKGKFSPQSSLVTIGRPLRETELKPIPVTAPQPSNPPAHADAAWKQVLRRYFPEFMCFFFPELASRIDWSAGIEFKDKELEALTTESMTGKRIADMLVQVRSKEGKPLYVLVHTEIVRRAKSHTGNEVISFQGILAPFCQRRLKTDTLLPRTAIENGYTALISIRS